MKRDNGPLRIGVVGLGRIAQAHIDTFYELPKEHALLTAVATRKRVPPMELDPAVTVHSRYEELLSDDSVDAVIICYPNAMHRDAVVAAARSGKHILVEKPIGMNAAEVEDMVSVADEHGVTLMSAQSRRFSDAIEAARRALPEIGPVFRIVINFLVQFAEPPTQWWKDPAAAGDLIVHLQGSHSVDTVVWLLNTEPDWVAARTACINPAFGGADEADMLMSFGERTTASVHLSLNTKPYHHELVVVGSEGSMRMREYPTGVPFGVAYHLEVNGETRVEGPQNPTIYTKQLAEFVTAIRENRQPLASGREVLRTTRVLDMISAAARTRKTVTQ